MWFYSNFLSEFIGGAVLGLHGLHEEVQRRVDAAGVLPVPSWLAPSPWPPCGDGKDVKRCRDEATSPSELNASIHASKRGREGDHKGQKSEEQAAEAREAHKRRPIKQRPADSWALETAILLMGKEEEVALFKQTIRGTMACHHNYLMAIHKNCRSKNLPVWISGRSSDEGSSPTLH